MANIPSAFILRAAERLNTTSLLRSSRIGARVFRESYFLYKRYLEDPFHRLSRNHPELFRGGNILDVGANIGYTASVFLKALSPGCKVVCFEPEPVNFSHLTSWRAGVARSADVVLEQLAVGASAEPLRFWINERHHGDHRVATDQFAKTVSGQDFVEVAGTSLDSYCESKGMDRAIKLVKIDVQGFELEVLRGMERLVDRNPALAIALEYDPRHMETMGYSPRLLLDWIVERGLGARVVTPKGDLAPFDVASANKYLYANLIAARSLCKG